MDIPEQGGIIRAGHGHDPGPEVLHQGEFPDEIHLALPPADRPGHIRADALDRAQFALSRMEDFDRRAERIEQPPHPHRPDLADHVQRDECLRFRHGRGVKTRFLQNERGLFLPGGGAEAKVNMVGRDVPARHMDMPGQPGGLSLPFCPRDGNFPAMHRLQPPGMSEIAKATGSG